MANKLATGLLQKVMKKFHIVAMTTIWGDVYYDSDFDMSSSVIQAHENCHLMQMKELGPWRYLFVWIKDCWKYGYENNPLEVQAREESTK